MLFYFDVQFVFMLIHTCAQRAFQSRIDRPSEFIAHLYFLHKLHNYLGNMSLLKPCADYQTDCDIIYEKQCRAARLSFLLQLQLYDQQTKIFFKKQREHADALWRISVKFNILRE